MKARRVTYVIGLLALVLIQISPVSFAQTAQHWVPTWVSAPQQPRVPPRPPANAPATPRPAGPPIAFNNQTIRMVVHTSIPGRRVRVQLSNAYGAAPVSLGPVHIALRGSESAIVSGSDRTLTFNGKPTVSIPPGAFMLSDAADLDVPKLGDVLVSVYVPSDSGPASLHANGLHPTYISKTGDATGEASIADPILAQSYYFLASVDVEAPAAAAAIVTLGDSITDGTRSTPNTDSAWPSALARRVLANSATSNIAVLNQGIAANRVLRDGIGVSALARLDRDVLSVPGVKWMTIMEGINDIGAGLGANFVFSPRAEMPANMVVTPEELIGAYKQVIERAHEHGIKVFGSTLTPFEGAAYYTEHGNETRMSVNQWIRTSGAFDGVLDFDAVIRNPESANKFRAEFDSSDHLHPNDAGYKAMAEAFDLAWLTGKSSKRK